MNEKNELRYLVKAKRLDTAEWVIGFLTIMWQQYHIIPLENENTAYPIDTDTICMCTGICAINEVVIREYDVIKHYNNPNFPENFSTGVIIWDEARAGFRVYHFPNLTDSYLLCNDCKYEVVGNVLEPSEFSSLIMQTENIHPAFDKVKAYLSKNK